MSNSQTMAVNQSGTPSQGSVVSSTQHQSNFQRIALKKQQVAQWSRSKKLEKLATYSGCKAQDCKCTSFKNPNPPAPQGTAGTPRIQPEVINLADPCRTCSHTFSSHITHLESVSDEELNRLLSIAIDVENLFMCVHIEEDADTKQVYYYLFKLLRKSILIMTKPAIEGGNPLGHPPFEQPSIVKGVGNFVVYKFGNLSEKEWQTMYDLAKMFLHCLNNYKLETPNGRKQSQHQSHTPHIVNEDITVYKINYTRWLCYCHVPAFCNR